MTVKKVDRLFAPGKRFFEFNLKYLTYTGLWPIDEWPKFYLFLYKCYEVTLHILTVVFFVIAAIGTYELTNDTMMFLINLDKSLVAYFFFIKSILFIRLRKRLKILITEIMYTGDKISEARNELMATHVKVIAVLSLSLCGLFSLVAIYKGEMTLEAWMPFDPKKNKMNLNASAQILAITFMPNLCRSVGVQGIVCSLIMYICDQLVEVQNRIKALRYNPATVREMREEFNEIVKKHVRLIRYSNYLSDLFSDYLLIQNGGITIELCLNALMVTMVKEKETLVNFLAFLTIALINAYIYYYLGDQMITDSQGIALAAYETPWTQWPLDMQKKLLIVIMAAQKPLGMSAGGMATISLETFSLLLYNGYSVFAVLNDAVD